jgi:digeranylgeranylglycerophospholipid reductase
MMKSRRRGKERYWDAVIVGAGPAGASAALCLTEAGWNVLIVEKRRQVGIPVQCAEYIPYPLAQKIGAPSSVIARKVGGLRTFIQGKLVAENHWPGVVLDRALFDQYLARQAVRRGATLYTDCRMEALEDNTVLVRKEGRQQRVGARIIVGADGPLSAVGRSMGIRKQHFVYGLQVEAPLAIAMDHTEAHFRPEFLGGYGWVFPKRHSANVGVGVVRSAAASLPRLLDAFLDELRARGVVGPGPALGKTGGLIPAGGPPARTVWGHVLVAGDAAGQTDPITGSGIPAAVQCGQTAGRVICDALIADDPHRIRDYEEEWRAVLEKPLQRALRHRRTQRLDWNRGPFEGLIRRTWIAFPEYFGGL